jgi:hypothetical protein
VEVWIQRYIYSPATAPSVDFFGRPSSVRPGKIDNETAIAATQFPSPSLSSPFLVSSYLRVHIITRIHVRACGQLCKVRILFVGAAYLWPVPLALSRRNKTCFLPNSFSLAKCPVVASLILLMCTNDEYRVVDRGAISNRKG